jgi:hypothetical protein
MTGRRPIVDYDEEGPFIRLSGPAAEDADPAANPGWWEAAIHSGDYEWDGETCDDAPAPLVHDNACCEDPNPS